MKDLRLPSFHHRPLIDSTQHCAALGESIAHPINHCPGRVSSPALHSSRRRQQSIECAAIPLNKFITRVVVGREGDREGFEKLPLQLNVML